MIVRRILLCLLPLFLAACSSSGSPPPSPFHGRSATANRAAAGREASRLLSLVRLPRGTHPLSVAPPHSGAAIGVPAVSSLVDEKRFWSVPMSFSAAAAWFKAHPPKGNLESTGSSSGGGPGYQESGIAYRGRTSPAWQSAELGINVSSGDNGYSYVRADAIVVWLDPVPSRDTSSGPRIHFSAVDGCPRQDRGTPDVRNTGADLNAAMLPSEPPLRALVCTYDARHTAPFQLTAHRLLNATAAAKAAETIRNVPLSHADGASVSCPAAFAATGYIAVDYRDRAGVDVRIDLSGCPTMTNGMIQTAAGQAVGLFTRIEGPHH